MSIGVGPGFFASKHLVWIGDLSRSRDVRAPPAHHVTQRGNGRRFILDSDTDRSVYLDLLKQSLTLHADHSSGHVWQGRYYSCPLDENHLWEALRYTELNPVRASLVAESAPWILSSAAAHCAAVPDSDCLAMQLWQSQWNAASWRAFLEVKESGSELAVIRLSTHTGRPLGTAEFVHALERSTQRPLAPQKRGRRPQAIADPRQSVLRLDA
jgi:REP element-mobilizing transposase RayT